MKCSFIDTLFNIVLPFKFKLMNIPKIFAQKHFHFYPFLVKKSLHWANLFSFNPPPVCWKSTGWWCCSKCCSCCQAEERSVYKSPLLSTVTCTCCCLFLSELRKAFSEKGSVLATWQSLKMPFAEMCSGSVQIDCLDVVANLTCCRTFSNVFGNPVRAWSLGYVIY